MNWIEVFTLVPCLRLSRASLKKSILVWKLTKEYYWVTPDVISIRAWIAKSLVFWFAKEFSSYAICQKIERFKYLAQSIVGGLILGFELCYLLEDDDDFWSAIIWS